ncbi:MAG: SusC/RagA family TonB-linked outer membrane protein [Prevotella sp.]|nr:SusC/RagA family TonB-linked outer membrane protein [Prevotella sp.]
MKKRLLMVLAGLFLSVGALMAQTRISGTVISQEDGEPLIGVTITVKDSKENAVTNIDGHFQLTTDKKNPSIVVTYVGFVTQTLKGKQDMRIELEPDSKSLDEVVVTGVQKMDKRMFSGATTKVDADKAKLSGMADVSRSLEGRVAGVSVQNVSGTFGTAPKIRVRGATSIYGTSSPLWVVDGVILEGAVDVSADELSSGNAETLISNAIAGLNADDIESFQVLKDGSATSIYGARAMSGVIVITTKKGRSGHSTINYTGEFTYRLKPSYSEYNISNSQEQMGIYKEMAAKGWLEFSSLANGSSSGLYGRMYTLISQYDETKGEFGLPYTDAAMNAYLQQAEFRNTDWFDLLFNNNIVQTHSVSISSGTENSNLYASLSAYNDPGWTPSSKVERYTANINASFDLSKHLSVTMRSNGYFRNQDAPGTLNRSVDPVSGAVSRSFDIAPFSYAMNTSRTLDPEGYYTRNYAPFNIFEELGNNYLNLQETSLQFQGEISWKPIQGLEINALGSYRNLSTSRNTYVLNHSNRSEAYRAGVDNPNIRDSNTYLYRDPDEPNSLPISVMPQGGIHTLQTNNAKQLYFRGQAQYNKVWNEGTHVFNALAGMEARKLTRDAYENNKFGVDYENSRLVIETPKFYKQAKEEGTVLTEFAKSWNYSLAYFANLNYMYKGRYVINVTGRYDGSNQLGKSRQSRWLPTWNISPSWNIDEEPFFQRFSERVNGAVSYAKLRMSYSLVGDQTAASNALPVFRSVIGWRPQADQQETGIEQTQYGNQNLTYEKKYEYNIGLDLGFLKNRLNLVFDAYWRDNFDLMGYLQTQTQGRQFANVAGMKSRGVEATITSKNIQTKDFQWTTDLTYAYNHTEITDLLSYSRVIDLVQTGGYARVGYDHRALFSIPFVGLNDEGIPQIINQNGDVTTTNINFQEYDKLDFLKYEGPTEPTTTGGLNNMFKYKNWRLNIFLTYSFGNKVRLDPVFGVGYSDMTAMPKEFKNRWVEPGDEKYTDIPAIASIRQYYNNTQLGYAYNAYNYSTARVAKGDFIRMKDISLTYDFSKNLLKHVGLSSASLKLDATNLFLIYADDKLNGQDPEFVNAGGVANPLSKQFTMTVRLGI